MYVLCHPTEKRPKPDGGVDEEKEVEVDMEEKAAELGLALPNVTWHDILY